MPAHSFAGGSPLIIAPHNLVVEAGVEHHPPARDSLNASAFVRGIATLQVGRFKPIDCYLCVGKGNASALGQVLYASEPRKAVGVLRGQQREPDNARRQRLQPHRRIQNRGEQLGVQCQTHSDRGCYGNALYALAQR